jgi:hypothetical protein
LIEIINKPLLLHLVGYLYYWQMGFNSVFKGLIETVRVVMEQCVLPSLPVRDNTTEGVIVQVVTFQPRFKFESLMFVLSTAVAIMLWEEGTMNVSEANERYLVDSVLCKDTEPINKNPTRCNSRQSRPGRFRGK